MAKTLLSFYNFRPTYVPPFALSNRKFLKNLDRAAINNVLLILLQLYTKNNTRCYLQQSFVEIGNLFHNKFRSAENILLHVATPTKIYH